SDRGGLTRAPSCGLGETVAAEQAGEILAEGGAGHDEVAAGFLGLDLEVGLEVVEKADEGGFLQLGLVADLADGGDGLQGDAVEVEDDEGGRDLGLFEQLLIGFDQLEGDL